MIKSIICSILSGAVFLSVSTQASARIFAKNDCLKDDRFLWYEKALDTLQEDGWSNAQVLTSLGAGAVGIGVGVVLVNEVVAYYAGLGLGPGYEVRLGATAFGTFLAIGGGIVWFFNSTVPAESATMTDYFKTSEGFLRFMKLDREQQLMYLDLDGELGEMVMNVAEMSGQLEKSNRNLCNGICP